MQNIKVYFRNDINNFAKKWEIVLYLCIRSIIHKLTSFNPTMKTNAKQIARSLFFFVFCMILASSCKSEKEKAQDTLRQEVNAVKKELPKLMPMIQWTDIIYDGNNVTVEFTKHPWKMNFDENGKPSLEKDTDKVFFSTAGSKLSWIREQSKNPEMKDFFKLFIDAESGLQLKYKINDKTYTVEFTPEDIKQLANNSYAEDMLLKETYEDFIAAEKENLKEGDIEGIMTFDSIQTTNSEMCYKITVNESLGLFEAPKEDLEAERVGTINEIANKLQYQDANIYALEYMHKNNLTIVWEFIGKTKKKVYRMLITPQEILSAMEDMPSLN